MWRGRLKLVLILLLFAAPILGAEWSIRHWQPARYGNYGMLLEPTPVEFEVIQPRSAAAFDPAGLRGRWVLMLAAPAGCDGLCRRQLHLMRQVRLATGRDRDRIERLLVTEVPLAEDFGSEQGALRLARFRAVLPLAELARLDSARHIYLLDPLGRLVLRFPADADGGRVLRDLQRLLRYSRMG